VQVQPEHRTLLTVTHDVDEEPMSNELDRRLGRRDRISGRDVDPREQDRDERFHVAATPPMELTPSSNRSGRRRHLNHTWRGGMAPGTQAAIPGLTPPRLRLTIGAMPDRRSMFAWAGRD